MATTTTTRRRTIRIRIRVKRTRVGRASFVAAACLLALLFVAAHFALHASAVCDRNKLCFKLLDENKDKMEACDENPDCVTPKKFDCMKEESILMECGCTSQSCFEVVALGKNPATCNDWFPNIKGTSLENKDV